MYTTYTNFALVRGLPTDSDILTTCCNYGEEHTVGELFADTLGRVWCAQCLGDAKVSSIYELGMYELIRLLDRLDINILQGPGGFSA